MQEWPMDIEDHVKNLKKKILKHDRRLKQFFNLLEEGIIRPGKPFHHNEHLDFIPGNRRLHNLQLLEFIYIQILFAIEGTKYKKHKKRQLTLAEKYWKEREKFEYRLWKQGKDFKLVQNMPKFARTPTDYTHPYYLPATLKIRLTNASMGRPKRDWQKFLRETISVAIEKLIFPASRLTHQKHRLEALKILFTIIK